jgi:non-specific serine/threonine protein kinase
MTVAPKPGPRAVAPCDATSFVGRRAELRRIRELLAEVRLLSLIGIGGVGKTRLAKEAIAVLRRSFRDGVCFVDLTALQDEALLEQVVRDSVPGASGATSLVSQLADLNLLLVLDNCEHVCDALGSLVSEVVAWCPGVRILATSRLPLEVSGEYLLRVAPLETTPAARQLTDSAALFRDRVGAAGGSLNATDLAAVDELCTRLDGLPLAIELAATKTRTMTIPEIIARLDDRFGLLRGGPRDSQPRHQSLDAMLRWSWEQCTGDERRLWTQLSLFAGPASLRAIVGVCGFGESASALDTVDKLVQQSLLVRAEAAGEASFGMLETIREYGRRQLAEDGIDHANDEALGAFRDRHLRYFQHLAATARERWFGASQRQSAQLLAASIADIRLAFEWALTTDRRIAHADALFADLWLYWVGCGHLHEARTWAHLLWARLDEHDQAPTCRSQWTRGWVSVVTGDLADARYHLRRCRDRAPSEGTERDGYTARGLLAACHAIEGNYPLAVEQYEEALAEARADGHPLSLALMLQNYAEISMMCGDFTRAERSCDSSEQVCAAHGDEWCYSHVVWVRAIISYMRGEYPNARAQGLRALGLKISVEDQLGMALALEVLAWTAAAEGDHAGAAVVLGGTEVYWGSAGCPLMGLPRLIELRNSCLRALSDALGPARLRRALDEGANMGLERLTLLRSGVPDGPLGHAGQDGLAPPTDAGVAPSDMDALTAREREVAFLVGEGLTNRAIAARLVIGPRTVETHVARVLAKLGVLRRSEIAAIVARSGLDSPRERV